ncbi:hypothetical protein KAR48_01195 [bacterium]|nr:hypothetical protein [bacterium]
MKKLVAIVTLLACMLVFLAMPILAQQDVGDFKSKYELQKYLDSQNPNKTKVQKASDAFDRKRSILNVGNVEARIRNAGTLGYDRDGKCYEFPAGGGITYRWTMGPMIGAIIDGQKWAACGTYGAARGFEDEFEPIGGLDAGWSSDTNNYGIAASDRPDTWPSVWPPAEDNMPVVGATGFPGILDGEVVATRELYFAVTDAKNNDFPNTIRIDMWGIQYEDFINEDFIIYKMLVTNISDKVMEDVYIGMHDDPDTPEQGASEWTDDYAALIAKGDDVDGYTASEDTLLWNFSYLWDGDDRVQGLIPSKVAWVGLKILETPEDPANPGNPMGLTTMDVFAYSNAPQTTDADYNQLASGIKPPDNVEPHAEDWTQTPNSYGPDITYVVGSGPFTLNPGETLNFALASVHGVNKNDLFNNAMLCQILYNNDYAAAEAPPEPKVIAYAGDHSVTLHWDGTDTEQAIYRGLDGSIDHIGDKLTGNNSFEGYQIYKSLDRGLTWGDPVIDIQGVPKGYIPLAQYDIVNGIQGESETRRFFWLGSDNGLAHSFTDNNVQNGYEYWYAVVAYDSDDGPIPPLANAIKKDAATPGDNTVKAIPLANVSGFEVGAISADISHSTGNADGEPAVTVYNPAGLMDANYTITFSAAAAAKAMDTQVLSKTSALPAKDAVAAAVDGFTVTNTTTGEVVVNNDGHELKNWPFYDEDDDNIAFFDGLGLKVPPVAAGAKSITGSGATYGTDYELKADGYYNLPPAPDHDYEFEFTSENYTIFSLWNILGYGEPDSESNYKVTDITSGEQICVIWEDRGDYNLVYDHGEKIMLNHTPYAADAALDNYSGFKFKLNVTTAPAVGDKITVITNKVYTESDVYSFSTTKETAANVVENDLKKITTVPNPFVVSSRFEIGAYGIEKVVQFHHLPPECTIRIYNMAGDLINTIHHDNGTPLDKWTLQSSNGQEVAFGIYFYHIDAPGIGEHVGKMAIIK